MLSALRFQASNPCIVLPLPLPPNNAFTTNINSQLRFSFTQPFSSLVARSHQPSHYTTTVQSSPLQNWNLTHHHLTLLNVLACTTAICATWLFCSAIPALLAFKKAAESAEKLMDATREDLPNTMAAIRLSGMEISDLTTELSDIGQEITQGVRSSTRAVRLAEQRLHRLTTMSHSSSAASLQGMVKDDPDTPVVAKTARGVREGIVKGRSILQMFFTLARFSRFAFNYVTGRR